MKRITSIAALLLAILMLLLCCAACGGTKKNPNDPALNNGAEAAAPDADLPGTYRMTDLYDTATDDESDYEGYLTLEIRDDYTATVTYNTTGESYECTFDYTNGKVMMPNDFTASYTRNGNTLTIMGEGKVMTFKKEK